MDGSVIEDGSGSSACVSLNTIYNPYNKTENENENQDLCLTKPAGQLCHPSEAEQIAIDMTLDYIIAKKEQFQDKRILIGSDSQSCLVALEKGPQVKLKYLGINTSTTWKKLTEVSK
eukprot:4901963-Ditylum_brightwellii.AAC.1